MEEGLTRWEPRIELVDVTVTGDNAAATLWIDVTYRLRATQEVDHLRLPVLPGAAAMTVDPDRGRIARRTSTTAPGQDLVDEMRALIPQYAPAWTDQNPSDLGITLIELFAWLGESVIYRLNQVPEKNYLAFVNLLGITRAPATPARTHLTFTSGPAAVVVPAGTQAQTVPAEGEEPVVFETDEPVRVLPVALQHAVLVTTPAAGASSYADATGPVVGPPAGTFAVTVPAGRTVQLCLGFDAASRRGAPAGHPAAPATAGHRHGEGALDLLHGDGAADGVAGRARPGRRERGPPTRRHRPPRTARRLERASDRRPCPGAHPRSRRIRRCGPGSRRPRPPMR